jgi:hypothetical protein
VVVGREWGWRVAELRGGRYGRGGMEVKGMLYL